MDCLGILDCLSAHKDAIESIRNILLVLAAVVGLIFLYFRTRAQTRSSKAQDRQASLSERGHLTDRFIKAIDQLGAMEGDQPNIEVRLGGIYGLEQLANESDELYPQITEVLSAYVRSNSKNTACEEINAEGESVFKYRPMIDIQAILTVIGRRVKRNREAYIDLSGVWLSGYSFVEGDFSHVIFKQAHCEGAKFMGLFL